MANKATQFKKGQSGNPNGCPKGLIKKFRFDVAAILKAEDCNPFAILAEIAQESHSVHARVTAAAELCSFVAPKLKSIEHKGDKDAPLKVLLQF